MIIIIIIDAVFVIVFNNHFLFLYLICLFNFYKKYRWIVKNHCSHSIELNS